MEIKITGTADEIQKLFISLKQDDKQLDVKELCKYMAEHNANFKRYLAQHPEWPDLEEDNK